MTVPREPINTISFIDQYCSNYQHLFPDVRAFEHFKSLQLGMIALPPVMLRLPAGQCDSIAQGTLCERGSMSLGQALLNL